MDAEAPTEMLTYWDATAATSLVTDIATKIAVNINTAEGAFVPAWVASQTDSIINELCDER